MNPCRLVRTPLLIAVLVCGIGACGKGREYRKVDETPAREPTDGTQVVDGLSTRWERLEARIPNLEQRKAEALEMLRDARELKEDADDTTGGERERLLERAKERYAEAGNAYDRLWQAADDLDERLWDRRFHRFQRKWDRLSKGLKRLGYR